MIRQEPGTQTALKPGATDTAGAVEEAIRRSHEFFLREQKSDGFWVAPLEADTTLESDYVLMLRLLGIEAPDRVAQAVRCILRRQLPSGGWNIYAGGPDEINATVKAYAALKLSGAKAGDPPLVRAREAVARLGGPARLNTFSRTYLNLIGQFPSAGIPTLPPELILNPSWFYFNIYEISSWSRAILVPLSVVSTRFPRIRIPEEEGIGELFPGGQGDPALRFQWSPDYISWRNFFLIVDRIFKLLERTGFQPLRPLALRRAESWILERFEESAGLGAIYPAMLNSILALRALGYRDSHPQFRRAFEEFEKLIMDRGDHLQFQPCESPVWDTGLVMLALLESGMDPSHPALLGAAQWLLERQTRQKGDWSVKNPRTPPGGWYFEYANEFYPDLDDTCVALMVLKRVTLPDNAPNLESQNRGLRWLLEMQCRNGGWASFDRDNDKTVFTKVPFADHNAMLDPPTADITGRILEMLSHFGYGVDVPTVRRAIEFIRSDQEKDGSWFGRWGVNYIYGTWQVLKGLSSIGEDMGAEYIRRAAAWLRTHQNPDGGWGESCRSYDEPALRGRGPSTPSQTAWAVMGLLSAGEIETPPVRGGLEYLLSSQKPDGSWDEEEFTGTGFPRVFYLRYNYYRNYFPLFALGMYSRLAGRVSGAR